MSLFQKLLETIRPAPLTPEDIAAEAEAKRLADQIETTRLSQRSGSAGENYQSGRGTQ